MKRCLLLVVIWIGGLYFSTAADQGKKYYVQFIQGSNDEKPPTATAKAIGPKLSRKLHPVFRWKHYWELDRQEVIAEAHQVNRIRLNAQRSLEIEPVGDTTLELRLYREKRLVRKARHQPQDKMAIMGGEQSPDNAWFVVVRSEKPR